MDWTIDRLILEEAEEVERWGEEVRHDRNTEFDSLGVNLFTLKILFFLAFDGGQDINQP